MFLMKNQYGIFSTSLNCFLLASDDIWLTMHTARLAHSKISCCICNISRFEDIQREPEKWTVVDLSEISHQPILHEISNGLEPFYCDSVNLKNSKNIINHIYNITRSARITDAKLNIANHNLFLSLLDETNFSGLDDIIGADVSFLKKIDIILYQSQTVEEINERITDFFENTYSLRPQMLRAYKNIFFNTLNNEI